MGTTRRQHTVSFALAFALLGAWPGCSPGSRSLGWTFEFEDPAAGMRARVVVGRILEGGCSSGRVVYADEAGRGEMPSMSPVLGPGRYGFEGVARDVDCVAFATGCVEVDVPEEEGAVVIVRLLAATESSACSAAICNDGHCGALDAGGIDGGMDAGRDAAGDAGDTGPPMDVPRDAPVLDGGRDAPIDVPPDAGIPRVVSSYAPGLAFACAITTDGALFCWGGNLSGQLGQGTSGIGTELSSPTRVGTGTTWTGMGVGDAHICGTLGTALHCWGDNEDGQIGTGDMVNRSSPARVGTVVGPFTTIDGASLGDHTCVLRSGGTIECIGQNDYGQLGLADNVDHVALGAWAGTYRALNAGHHFTCAIGSDGSLVCTGRNNVGQLGQGAVGANSNVPIPVGTGTDWTALGAGDSHVCGLRGAGELWCWGLGSDGRLGTGAIATVSTPTRIGTGVDWSEVSSGGTHSCGLRGAGELWCWGNDADGQLGNGAGGADVLTPTRIGTASDWTSVRAGGAFTCGTRGTDLYCWGANASGALGIGDTAGRNAPELVRIY